MKTRSRPIIIGLDALRFGAAFLVMLYHFGTASWADPTTETARIVKGAVAFPELFRATWSGWIGVEIFFVISGLVIAYSADGASPYKFFRSRVIRLYPAVWICGTITLVTLLLAQEGSAHLPRRWAASVTLFPLGPWIDSVYWTLGIEMAFYALVFVMLAVDAYHRLEPMTWILGGLSSCYWLLGSLVAPGFLHDHLWSRVLELSLLPYGCFFATGSMTYLASRRGVSWGRCAAIAVFVAAGCVEIGYKADYNNVIFHAHETAFQPQAIFVAAMVLVFASMRLELKNAGVGHAFRLLGLTTYPLYLLHNILGAEIMKRIVASGGSPYAALGGAIAVCVAAAALIAVFAEPVLQATLRRLFARFETGARKFSWCDFLFNDTRLVDAPAGD